jgi:hypothetical protein
MKIKTTIDDQPILDWVDSMAKYFRRSRSQQIMWLLKRLMIVQTKESSSLISKAQIFNGLQTPKITL